MQKPKIVLLEDEEDIAALIKLQGEISGYKIVVETDGINGFRTIERETRSGHPRHHAAGTKWSRRVPQDQNSCRPQKDSYHYALGKK